MRQRIVDEVPAPHSQVFDRPVRSSEWYPYSAYTALLQNLERAIGRSARLLTLRDVGRWTGKRDLGGILRVVLAFTSPDAVVARGFGVWGPAYWSRFCDTGSMRLTDQHTGGASITLEGFPSIARQHCVLMEGWWEAMAEGAGAHGAKVWQSQCVHRGDACCRYVGTWS